MPKSRDDANSPKITNYKLRGRKKKQLQKKL